MYPAWMRETFEEFLDPHLDKLGPFVAIGNPQDPLPTPGASKVYCGDDEWQQMVLHFLNRAGAVVLLEGSTQGLHWELSQVRRRCTPRRVFLVTPTSEFPRQGWAGFALLLQQAGFEVPEADVGPGGVVGFDDELQPVVLRTHATWSEQYAAAVRSWVELPVGHSRYAEETPNGPKCSRPACHGPLYPGALFCKHCRQWLD